MKVSNKRINFAKNSPSLNNHQVEVNAGSHTPGPSKQRPLAFIPENTRTVLLVI